MRWLLVALLAVTLTWVDESDNEDGFLMQKTISGDCVNGWFDVATIPTNITMWVDDFAQVGDCYRVAAFNTFGMSIFSNTAQVPTVEEPKPCRNRGKKCRGQT